MEHSKRKIHIINNTRDSENCNDIRKCINSSNRQKVKIQIKNQLEELDYDYEYDYGWWYNYDKSSYYGYNWRYDFSVLRSTAGGKFIETLSRFGILSFNHKHYEDEEIIFDLLKKVSTNKDGLIF